MNIAVTDKTCALYEIFSLSKIDPKSEQLLDYDYCTNLLTDRINRPSDRVRLKNANYAKFSREIVRLERPIVRKITVCKLCDFFPKQFSACFIRFQKTKNTKRHFKHKETVLYLDISWDKFKLRSSALSVHHVKS